MALVGMASKPLHVRRLQKSLHEWAMNPAVFQAPLSHLGKAPFNFLKTNLQPNLFFCYSEQPTPNNPTTHSAPNTPPNREARSVPRSAQPSAAAVAIICQVSRISVVYRRCRLRI